MNWLCDRLVMQASHIAFIIQIIIITIIIIIIMNWLCYKLVMQASHIAFIIQIIIIIMNWLRYSVSGNC